MKKTLISIFLFLIVITILIIGIFQNNNKDDNNLTKVTVADTTLTSRTYIN